MSRILIVDDDAGILNALRRLLLRAPCRYGRLEYTLEVETFATPQAALERAGVTAFDLVLADFHMPRMDGVEFLARFRQIQPDAARMILSGTGDIDQLNRTLHRAEVFGTMLKPWNDEFLMAMIAEALTHRDLQLEKRAPALKEAPGGAAPPIDNPPG